MRDLRLAAAVPKARKRREHAAEAEVYLEVEIKSAERVTIKQRANTQK